MATTKKILAGGVLAGAVLAPSHAGADYWTSYMDDWLTGKDSRTWANNTSNDTVITISDCNLSWPDWYASADTKNTIDIQLTRQTPWWQPDENKGVRRFSCGDKSVGANYGDPNNGDYHFTLVAIAGFCCDNRLDYSDVRVDY